MKLTFIYIIILFFMEIQDFKVLKVSELIKILNNEKRDVFSFNLQLKTNNSFFYILEDSSVILMPNQIVDTNEGILFKDLKTYEFYLKNDSFPINEEKNIYFILKSEILNLKLEISKILIEENIKVNFDINKKNEVLNTLERFLKQKQQKWKSLTYVEKFYSLVILGEYLRIHNKAKWMLLKQYGSFNPYYVPVVLFDNGNFINIIERGVSFFESNYLSIETFINWDENTDPTNNSRNTFAHEFIVIE